MKCCKNCRWLKWVTTTGTSYYCEFVGGKFLGDLSDCCEAWKPTMRTNADRIRNMSDDELGEFLCRLNRDCYECPADNLCLVRSGYTNGMQKWLREEVKE